MCVFLILSQDSSQELLSLTASDIHPSSFLFPDSVLEALLIFLCACNGAFI